MATALAHGVVVIPFGGGTNISESLEPPRDERRTVVSVDMRKMDAVLEIDEVARLARVQAGVLGPRLEEQLNAKGWTFGHFPDSFTYSTLGGWIATRSSGMQSDKYGDIGDITQALRAVTPGRRARDPSGAVEVDRPRREPDDPRERGSPRDHHRGDGAGAPRAGAAQDPRLPLPRLVRRDHDDGRDRRERSVTVGHPGRGSERDVVLLRHEEARWPGRQVLVGRAQGVPPSVQALRHGQGVPRVHRLRGHREAREAQRKLVGEIVSRHNGICVGSGPGALYDQKKFDTPYIRDHLLNYGGVADVSETSAPWSVLPKLYDGVIEAAEKAFVELEVQGWIMCHLSHSYHSGACLYFTFAFIGTDRLDVLDQYATVKRAIQQAFMELGGTLSHHHAVGLAHAPWLEQDISAPRGQHDPRALRRRRPRPPAQSGQDRRLTRLSSGSVLSPGVGGRARSRRGVHPMPARGRSTWSPHARACRGR